MLVECERCGAPLDVKGSERLVKCRYCDTVNKTKSARTIAAETPPGWSPPPMWQPPPQARLQQALQYHQVTITAADRARKPSALAGCILAFAILIPIVISVFVTSAGSCSIGGPDADEAPTLGTFSGEQLAQGTSLQGSVAPGTSASTLSTGCAGYVESAPTIALTLTSPMLVELRTMSSADTTLIVRDPQGVFHCDDDSGGNRNASLSVGLPAGRSVVWVGSFASGSTSGFQLALSGHAIAAMPDVLGLVPQGPPEIGTFDLAAQPTGQLSGTVNGAFDAATLGPTCRGRIGILPHAIVVAAAETQVIVTASSTIDTVLVIRNATGQFLCDDDGAGSFNPRIAGALPPGANAIWVGSLSPGQPPTPFNLMYTSSQAGGAALAAGGIAPGADPLIRALTDSDLSGITTLQGETMDLLSAGELASTCRGHIPMAPHARLTLTRPQDLELRTTSTEDLTLVVQTAEGQFLCDDDSGGDRQPRVRGRFSPGVHAIWVGRYSQGAPVPFALQLRRR